MTPGGTSDEKLMVEQVERLGARRLAEIVVNHCHRDERLHQTVRIALAASTLGACLGNSKKRSGQGAGSSIRWTV